MLKTKTQTAVGLDIGSYSVKCVEVVQSSGSIELRRVSILPIGDRSPAGLKKILKVMFDVYNGRPDRLRISLSSGSSLIIRRIKLPVMSPAELKSAIVFEAEGHIPFPTDQCMLDFHILNHEADKKTMNVMLVAAKKDFVMDRLKVLSDMDVVPEIVDVDMFCLLNSFEVLGDSQGQGVFGILNIGHQMTSFAIIQNGIPFFVREIAMGGLGVTKALATLKNVSEDEADRLKIDKPADILEQLKEASQRGLEPLAEELRHSIDYFENETGEELKNIWTSGGGALSVGASDILTQELGRTVTAWNNLKKMSIFGEVDMAYLNDHSLELNVALGMVLRGYEAKK